VPTFALDTNAMVAAVCTWHEHHAAAAAEIERRLGRNEQLLAPAPALVETYAVLTRLPGPHRLSPIDAWTLVEANFIEPATVMALSGVACTRLLRRLAQQGIAGGRTYDAVIGECVRQGRADTLLTFNQRHFDPPPSGVTVIEPTLNR
jgi:predicted nucleic acid-binding protein